MAARKTYGGSNLSFSLQNDAISSSTEAFDALLMPNSSSSFTGMTSMVNFEDVCGRNNTQPQGMSFYRPHDQEENGDDDMDDCLRHPEKKRRLSVDQVQFLERSFAVDNKLEPERKIQLAKDLGLHPRQVAIWFQNRRARWKTKQLEKDYEELKGSYDSLKSNYEKLLKEKEKLEAEVLSLRQPELQKENVNGPSSGPMDEPPQLESQPKPVSEKQASELVIVKCKQEDLSSTNSGVFDSDSPNYPDAIRPSLLEPAVTSHARELDQSDLSQDEEDNLSKSLGRPVYNFPKLEYPVYVDQSATCGSYDFPVEEQTFWFWSCTE